MSPHVLLAMQAALTIIGVEQMRRTVLGAVNQLPQPEFVLDLWGPLAVVVPMLFLVGQVGFTVRGVGWMPIGAPIIAAVLALGAAMVTGDSLKYISDWRTPAMLRMLVACAGIGLVLLMLGTAHDLTLWMGQCAFAVAAVLMWINTPETPETPEPPTEVSPKVSPDSGGPSSVPLITRSQARAGAGITIAIACAIGQGLITMWLPSAYAPLSGAMMLAGAALILAAAAPLAGPDAAMRIGGWAAAYGVLFGLGLLAIVHLLPEAMRLWHDPRAPVFTRIANGFGEYSIEGLALLLFVIMGIVHQWLESRTRRTLGVLLIIATAALAGWRLMRM